MFVRFKISDREENINPKAVARFYPVGDKTQLVFTNGDELVLDVPVRSVRYQFKKALGGVETKTTEAVSA